MDGPRSTPVTVAGLAGGRASGSPRVARHGDELVFAWAENSGSAGQVRTVVARLPDGVTRSPNRGPRTRLVD